LIVDNNNNNNNRNNRISKPSPLHSDFRLSIKHSGLNKMSRNHIHFCSGLPGDDSAVISGFRGSSDVAIVIDARKAIADGIKFYRSENNVILSSGNSRGIIEIKYFEKVINLKTKKNILRN
jgi:2'-phosphotransferase